MQMKKIDRTVIRETAYVAAGTLILSVLLNAVFLIIGKWDFRVLLGNILGASAAVLNFFLMGVTVQTSIGKEEKQIKRRVWLSLLFRYLMLVGVAAIGYFVPSCFNLIAVVISYLFPRIAIMFRRFVKLPGDDDAVQPEEAQMTETGCDDADGDDFE